MGFVLTFLLRWFMRISQWAVLALVSVPISVQAQAPVSVPSAAGWGGSAMTEARFAESLLWNPALIVLPDAPSRSFTPPSVDIAIAGNRLSGIKDASLATAVLRGNTGSPSDWSRAANRGVVSGEAHGSVLWFGSHMTGFAITAVSQAHGQLDFGSGDMSVFGGMGEAGAGDSRIAYSLTSTLTGGRALGVGALPLLGHSWIGASAKYTHVHRHAVGTSLRATAREIASMLPPGSGVGALSDPDRQSVDLLVYEVTGGRIVGGDVGIVSNPTGAMLLSVTATNVFQSATVGGEFLRERHLYNLAQDGEGLGLREHSASVDAGALAGSERDAWEEHIESVRFPRMIRGAAAIDLRDFRVGVSGAIPYEDGVAIGRDLEERWGVSIGSPRGLAPRLSVRQTLDGAFRFGGGITQGSCSGRTDISLGVIQGERVGLGFSVAHAFGGSAGC